MGGALLTGWLNQGVNPERLTVVEPVVYQEIAQHYSVRAVSSYEEISQSLPPHMVVLAVKPQVLDQVLPAYAGQPNMLWCVSIAAGKPLAYYERYFGKTCPIVRAMPNLPATIGKGITALCANPSVHNLQRQQTETLFRAVGECVWIEQEVHMDAVTAISGSGPAYLFYFVECLREAGKQLGLTSDIAHHLALVTVSGSALLAMEETQDISILREAVTSPHGTTEAALRILQENPGLRELIGQAAKAAHKRAGELALN